ncbi:LysR family transcriptional regulator [Rhizobium sp. PAMB 3182]
MFTKATLRLKLVHLQLVAAVAQSGQISHAARLLAMTQPAASRMLSEIEKIVGMTLFERHPKGMTPTDAGRLLARRAHNVLTELGETSAEVEDFRRGVGGTVRVGAVTGGAVGYVVPAIKKLRQLSPKAEIHVEVASSDQLIRDLTSGTFDLILGRVPPTSDIRDFNIVPARAERIEFVVRRGHPLEFEEHLTYDRLGSFEWVMQSAGTPIRKAVEEAFISAGAQPPTNVTNTMSLLVMIAVMQASNAIAPMASEVSELICNDHATSGLTTLKLPHIHVSPYHLISLKTRRLSPLASRLRSLLQEQLKAASSMAVSDPNMPGLI